MASNRWWLEVEYMCDTWMVSLINRNGKCFNISMYKHKSNALKLARSIAESAGWQVREK